MKRLRLTWLIVPTLWLGILIGTLVSLRPAPRAQVIGGGGGTGSGGSPAAGPAGTIQASNGAGVFIAATADVAGSYMDPANALSGLVTAGTVAAADNNLNFFLPNVLAPVSGALTGTIWPALEQTKTDTVATLVANSSNATCVPTGTDVFPGTHNYNGALSGNLTPNLPTSGCPNLSFIVLHASQPAGGNNYVVNRATTSAGGGVVGPACPTLGGTTGNETDIAWYYDSVNSAWNVRCLGNYPSTPGISVIDSPTLNIDNAGAGPTCNTTLLSSCGATQIQGCIDENRLTLNNNCTGTFTITVPTSTTMIDAEQLNTTITYGTTAPSSIIWIAGGSGVTLRTITPGSTGFSAPGTAPQCVSTTGSGFSKYFDIYNAGASRLLETNCGSVTPITKWPSSMMSTNIANQNPFWAQSLGTGAEGAKDCNGNLSGTHYYTTFTVGAGETCTNNVNNSPLIIYATGACTLSATGVINARGADAGDTGSGLGGASGGGGGGGTLAGTIGSASGLGGSGTGLLFASGGAGGAASGGAAGNGVTPTTALLSAENFGYMFGGGAGGLGGSTGGAGGKGGGSVWLVCNSITIASGGLISVVGAVGTAGGVSTGGGGGGGGGTIVLAGYAVSNTNGASSFALTGGNGGAIGSGTSAAGGNGGTGVEYTVTLQ